MDFGGGEAAPIICVVSGASVASIPPWAFFFSAGSFIINEHLLKRFRVEERRGSDLLESDFAAPHQVVNPIPAYVIDLHRFRYSLAGPGAAHCNVRRF
jgi:hypothetical protein